MRPTPRIPPFNRPARYEVLVVVSDVQFATHDGTEVVRAGPFAGIDAERGWRWAEPL